MSSTQMLILETKNYNLSTRSTSGDILNADPNFKSRISFDVPDMIVRDESVEYIQFSIPYAVIPVSFYTVNEYNSKLCFIENDGNESHIIFPLGNYNATYFMTTFKKLMNGTANGSGRWSITLDDINSVFTVYNNLYPFSFLDTSTIDSVMGFSDTIVSSPSIPSPSSYPQQQYLDMPRCCNFLSLPRITLRCKELANSTMVGDIRTSDIVLTIPNNARPNSQIIYQNQPQSKTLFRGDKMDRFIVSLTDDDGNLLNFNGISSFWVFQFDIYRKLVVKPPVFSEIVSYVNSRNTMDTDE